MAGTQFSLTSPVGGSAITTSPVTVLQLVAAANHGCIIDSITVDLDAATYTDITIEKQSTDGSGNTANNPVVVGLSGNTLQATGNRDYTTEPTSTAIIIQRNTNASIEEKFNENDAIYLDGGERLGVVIDGAAATGNATVTIRGRE